MPGLGLRRVSWPVGGALVFVALPAMAQPVSGLSGPWFEMRAMDQASSAGQSPSSGQPPSEGQSGTSNNRLFGALPDFLTVENAPNIPPLTTRQKYDVTARTSFDLGDALFYGGLAGISQAQNADPSYHQGAAGYAKRFALATADGTVENFMVTAVFASLLHQDPRYFRLAKGSIVHRTGYSLSRIFVTRSDSGRQQFNFSEILGSAVAAGLYNTYHPASDRTFSNTMASWWMQVGYDTGFIVIREFWPDVRRKFKRSPKAPPVQ